MLIRSLFGFPGPNWYLHFWYILFQYLFFLASSGLLSSGISGLVTGRLDCLSSLLGLSLIASGNLINCLCELKIQLCQPARIMGRQKNGHTGIDI